MSWFRLCLLLAVSLSLLPQAATADPTTSTGDAKAPAKEQAAPSRLALCQSYPAVPGEMRGVWMCNDAEPSWAAATRALADANFNAVFPYMMSGGIAFYHSRALPEHPDVATHGDYLAEAVAAAKAAGVPIHARMLNLSTLFAPPAVRKCFADQGRLMVNTRGKTVNWLCPSNRANRQMEVSAALEMLAYGVDGIQFDYLRYPSADTCFCRTCRRKFESDLGVKVGKWPGDVTCGCYRGRFADWRREQITSLVGEIYHAIKAAKPSAAVSAAVFLNWEDHRNEFGQDWKTWIDRGVVDFVCPMDYTTNPDRFSLYVTRQEKWIAGKVPYAAGIGINADGYHFEGPEQVLEQIRIAREHGSQGFVIFNYNPALVRDYLPWLKLGVTAEPTQFQWGAGG